MNVCLRGNMRSLKEILIERVPEDLQLKREAIHSSVVLHSFQACVIFLWHYAHKVFDA